MQAASIQIQPTPLPPPAERPRDTGPDRPSPDASGGLSFSAILARSLEDASQPRSPVSSGGKPESGSRADALRRAVNNAKTPNADSPGALRTRDAGKRTEKASAVGPGLRPGAKAAPLDPTKAQASKAPAREAADALSGRVRKTDRDKKITEKEGVRGKTPERSDASAFPSNGAAISPAPSGASRALGAENRNPEAEPKTPESLVSEKRRNDRKDPKVSVVDLRMSPKAGDPGANKETGRQSDGPAQSRETAHVPGRGAEAPAPSDRAETAKPPQGSSFSDMLARHVADAGAQDIVKAAHIVLRDGDAGLIRLRLEPESLGNVKIELKLTEKNITGRIVVETDEARNAFERSLSNLRDAFSAGGFETASLEVSVGGGDARSPEEAPREREVPFFSDRLRELDRSVPTAPDAAYGADGSVSIWA